MKSLNLGLELAHSFLGRIRWERCGERVKQELLQSAVLLQASYLA